MYSKINRGVYAGWFSKKGKKKNMHLASNLHAIAVKNGILIYNYSCGNA